MMFYYNFQFYVNNNNPDSIQQGTSSTAHVHDVIIKGKNGNNASLLKLLFLSLPIP